ncbi:M56 family metallopeptidase [Clostridium sp. BJN0013]|uniref:M56 family metallopeptidase n=1 Tax=Clostridium sp. BJN0013 TaxID=3236840 RepID=UPI0034C6B546
MEEGKTVKRGDFVNPYSVFKMIVLSSIMGSIVAILIFIIKGLLKTRFNAAWQYYIWFLLIIRLIVPVGIETPLSRFNVIAPTTQKVEMNQEKGSGWMRS